MKEILRKYFQFNNVFALISIFFIVFSITLLVAILFTNSVKGIIVNLICSLIFMLAGIVTALISKNSDEMSKKNEN